MIDYIFFLYGACVYAAMHKRPMHVPEYLLLSRDDRLTSDESWQMRNFGIVRPDFMGWVIDTVMDHLVA